MIKWISWDSGRNAMRPTLSIWIYATLKYRYAVLLRMRLPLKRRPIGRIERMNMCFDM